MNEFSENAYQPPSVPVNPAASAADVDTFRSIAFWQRFFSVLLYIVSGISLLAFLGSMGFQVAGGPAPQAAVFALAVGSSVVVAAVVLCYLIPAFKLGRAARASREFGEGRISVSEYAAHQKGFWRYVGIMIALVMALYFGAFAVMLLVAG